MNSPNTFDKHPRTELSRNKIWLNMDNFVKKYNFLGKLGVQRAIIPIKCFVSHRPPPHKGGSVSRAKKKKKNEQMIAY